MCHPRPEKYREPLVLHYLQGQSQQQVAEQLGLSVTALEGRLRRGREGPRRGLVTAGGGLAAAHVASSTASAGSASLEPLIAATAKAAAAHAASQAVTSLVSQEAA